jgi:hypothetical protein
MFKNESLSYYSFNTEEITQIDYYSLYRMNLVEHLDTAGYVKYLIRLHCTMQGYKNFQKNLGTT